MLARHRVIVEYLNGPKSGGADSFPIESSKRLTIGSAPGCDVLLPAKALDQVAGHHAAIDVQLGRGGSAPTMTIRRLDPGALMHIGGYRIESHAQLWPGCEILLGSEAGARLRIALEEDEGSKKLDQVKETRASAAHRKSGFTLISPFARLRRAWMEMLRSGALLINKTFILLMVAFLLLISLTLVALNSGDQSAVGNIIAPFTGSGVPDNRPQPRSELEIAEENSLVESRIKSFLDAQQPTNAPTPSPP